MTPAERKAGMADCSLSGMMKAAMLDQEAAVAEARREALEEAAQRLESFLSQILSPEARNAVEVAAYVVRALKEQEPKE